MPPTHPSQAAVAAAYRTLIAHETEPKEQDFYRTRLQRLEQATEPECEFDCRSRVAAAGVGVYCPQCSAKCADTDLATELAKAIRAAWVDRLDWDELAHAALKFLTAAGRLVPAGGMALTAEPVEDVRIVLGLNGSQDIKVVLDAQARLRAMFPVPEPAEAAKPVHPRPDVGDWGYGGGAAVYAPEARGKTREELLSEKVEQLQDQVKHLSRVAVNAAEHGIKAPSGSLKPCGYCHSTEATLLHACTNCGAMTSDPWSHPTSAEPAEEAPNLAAVAQEPRRFDPADECQNDNHDPGCICGAQHWMTASAPAEPAEEEAVLAARGEGWYEGYEVGLEYGPIAASGEEYEGPINPYDGPTSSPVVPAPTEAEAGHA